MTEPTKYALVAFLAIAAVFFCAVWVRPSASAAPASDAAGDPVTRRQAASILDSAFGPSRPDGSPEPTPFPSAFVLEVTDAGNVAVPGTPYMLVIAGKCPPATVPPRCREDFGRLPPGGTLLCMRDDTIRRRLQGSE